MVLEAETLVGWGSLLCTLTWAPCAHLPSPPHSSPLLKPPPITHSLTHSLLTSPLEPTNLTRPQEMLLLGDCLGHMHFLF